MLPRTRLAYVHLPHLLTDAKRERSARLSGYVAVWLPEEFVVLYLQHGEVVNATVLDKGGARALAISAALELIPDEPEYGEICFHEADDDQLKSMFAAQTTQSEPWPPELKVSDPAALFPFLMSIMFDGMVEIISEDAVNYLLFKSGSVDRAFLSVHASGTIIERVAKLFAPERAAALGKLRRWSTIEALPVQAAPALVQAYRELINALVQKLIGAGRESAPAIAEQARQNLVKKHPELESFTVGRRPTREPTADTSRLTAAIASWIAEVMWALADHEATPPASLLKELTWERRHMFQSAGFYDKMPWKIQ